MVNDTKLVVEVSKPLKEIHYLEPNNFGVKMVSPFKLFPYQEKAVQWMSDREDLVVTNDHFNQARSGFLLAMVMGLGKTICVATLIARTIDSQRRQNSCSLYICPKNLLGTAKHEFHKFFGDQLKVMVFHRDFLRSSYNAFGEREIKRYDVIITNYSTVVARSTSAGICYTKTNKQKKNEENNFIKNTNFSVKTDEVNPIAAEFCNFNWFRIILDESHEIRTKSTRRFKLINSLNSEKRICMTGTPIHNTLKDLFHQLEFCGLNMKRGNKYTKQMLRKMNLMNMIKFVEYKDADSVKLPEKKVHKIFFDLSYEERFLHDYYIKTAQKVFKEINTITGRGKSKKTLEAHTSMLRIMQVCSAPYLITAASKKDYSCEDMVNVHAECVFPTNNMIDNWIQKKESGAGVKSSKMHRFVNLVKSINARTPGAKTVVFGNFTSSLRLALDALINDDAKYKEEAVFIHGKITSSKIRDNMFASFRTDPNVKLLIMTLKLGSVGLNLTEGSNVIFLEPWYSYAALSQGAARVHRIGQVNPVNVYYLLGKDSLEERVYHIAMEKKKLASDISSERDYKLGVIDMEVILFNNCIK